MYVSAVSPNELSKTSISWGCKYLHCTIYITGELDVSLKYYLSLQMSYTALDVTISQRPLSINLPNIVHKWTPPPPPRVFSRIGSTEDPRGGQGRSSSYLSFLGVTHRVGRVLSFFSRMSMDASFHGGSNDTIGGRVRPRRPEILLSYCKHCLIANCSPMSLIPDRKNQKA